MNPPVVLLRHVWHDYGLIYAVTPKTAGERTAAVRGGLKSGFFFPVFFCRISKNTIFIIRPPTPLRTERIENTISREYARLKQQTFTYYTKRTNYFVYFNDWVASSPITDNANR